MALCVAASPLRARFIYSKTAPPAEARGAACNLDGRERYMLCAPTNSTMADVTTAREL